MAQAKRTTRQRVGPASTTRRVWIAWCLLWAAVWFAAAAFSVILVPFLPLAFLSLLALLLPVGLNRDAATTATPADAEQPVTRKYALVRRQ